MSPIVKPMLAGKCERPNCLRFPVLATPKLDGIRCLKINSRALTRSFKPVSNQFTRRWIEGNLPDGVDDAKLKSAVETLLAKYPPEVVAVYLNAFNDMNTANWPNLKTMLENDARLQLGNHA